MATVDVTPDAETGEIVSPLAAFLTHAALEAGDNQAQAGQDAVQLMTVHSAKGTEAPVCYCLGVQPGVYPHLRSLGDKDAEEEERRVLYVALTRAQNELIITRAGDDSRTLFHGGSFVHAQGSPYFLEYLPSPFVEYEHHGYGQAMAGGSVLDELLDFE